MAVTTPRHSPSASPFLRWPSWTCCAARLRWRHSCRDSYPPDLESNEAALAALIDGIEAAGYVPGEDVAIALDPATSEIHSDGVYRLALTITDAVGPVTQEYKVRVDRRTPTLKRVSKRPLRVSLSEPARVTFLADGVSLTVRRPKAGIFRVVLDRPFTRLYASAADDAGNVCPRLRLR